MTVDDWPTLYEHPQCKGTSTPATWIWINIHHSKQYLCDVHMQRLYNKGYVIPTQWVKLTPNQRPSPVQEVQSGSQDQGQD